MSYAPSGLSLPRHYADNTRTLVLSGVLQASLPDAPVDDDGLAWEETAATLVLTPTQYRPQARAMLGVGHSMDDGGPQAIQHGDIVLVDPRILGSVYHNTRNTVISTPNGYIVKERDVVNGKHLLVSRNPNYPPIKLQPEWRLEGVVYARYLGKKQVKFL